MYIQAILKTSHIKKKRNQEMCNNLALYKEYKPEVTVTG